MILGYLAFRGIQNDRALLEKRKLDEHRRLAEQITTSIDGNISKVEQAFFKEIANRQKGLQSEFIILLNSFKKEYALVEEIFLFQNSEKIHFPAAKLLFVPDGSTPFSSSLERSPALLRKIQTAQQLEFQQKNYKNALISYQQAKRQTSDHQGKGELLNAIARVQKKSSLFQDAIKSYETIAQDYSQIRITNGIPLGLAARLELGFLYLADKNSLTSIKTYIKLYKDLINREWALEKAQYDFFEQNTKESIENILSQDPLPEQLLPYKNTFQTLRDEGKKQRERTEKLLTFQENAVTDLQTIASRNLNESQDISNRFTLDIGRNAYLVSWKKTSIEKLGEITELWGILLDSSYLKDDLLQKTLENYLSTGKTEWIIRGRNSQVILTSEITPSGSPTVKTNFASNFPDWSVELFQKDPRLLETFLTSRQGIFFYMFLLIGGILIFGLILTVRTVARELELARMKSDFVSTISHEFKSPLTSIRQLAEMLHSGRVPSEERRQKYYEVLLEQSERLSLLTENVLDLAKIEEGRKEFEFREIDIGSLLNEIVSTIQERVSHENFNIQLKIDKSLPKMKIDSEAMTQALTNLIDNALKYSGETKKIIVSSHTENQSLIISVKDFGMGIKKEERDKVFERFYRGGNELTRTVKGSGLGLTLVKQIVEAHNGTVQVESEPGQGSTFSIRLPLK